MRKYAALLTVLILGATPGLALAQRSFTPEDLVMLDRVTDPNLSPDETSIAYQLRQTDFAANKGVTSIWLLGPTGSRALTSSGSDTSPRWRSDGKMIYFLS